MARKPEPNTNDQLSIDFVRGEQLRLLQDAQLPKNAKDATGKGVSAKTLKAMLRTIDEFSRGRRGGCWASVQTLADAANIDRRTAFRALDVLEHAGLICREAPASRRGHYGSPTSCYTIVWSELSLLVDRGLLGPRPTSRPPRPTAPGTDQLAPDQSGTRPPWSGPNQSGLGTDQSGLGTDQSGLGTDQSGLGPPKALLSVAEPLAEPLAGSWAAAAEEFRGVIGPIDELARLWRARRHTPDAFRQAIRDALAIVALPANATRLRRPIGAAIYWLRHGTWPIDGIVSLAEQAERDAQRRAVEEQARAQRERQAAERQREEQELAELESLVGATVDQYDTETETDRLQAAGIDPGIYRRYPKELRLRFLRFIAAEMGVTQ